MTIKQAIEHAEEVAIEQEYLMGRYDAASGYNRSGNEAIRTESAKKCEKCAEEHRQLAGWLRELQERRKADSCEGCVREFGKTYLLVCASCKRRYADLYEAERRADG
jgi:hypothetical protein